MEKVAGSRYPSQGIRNADPAHPAEGSPWALMLGRAEARTPPPAGPAASGQTDGKATAAKVLEVLSNILVAKQVGTGHDSPETRPDENSNA
jgi:hypothetical protein